MQHHLHLSWPPTPMPIPSLSIRNPKPNPNPRIRASSATTPSSSSSSSSQSPPILPNALRRRNDPMWTAGGFSLGVDLGNARTGLALSKGFSPRPLAVLELRGQKLELRLLEIAYKEEVDEFIIGLPRSYDGKETPQSNKVRSIAGRLAGRAAERGLKKSARQGRIDAYAAMMVLERYFSMSGGGAELVLPKQPELQEKLRKGSSREWDF